MGGLNNIYEIIINKRLLMLKISFTPQHTPQFLWSVKYCKFVKVLLVILLRLVLLSA